MRKFFIVVLVCCSLNLWAQDLTGTWEGELMTDGQAWSGIQRTYKLKWEIVQIEKEVFGIVYFYPQDTKPTDKPNVWYTWYGKLGKKNSFPFQFIRGRFIDGPIQGRYIDGPGSVNTYQFNVKFEQKDSIDILSGSWYNQLEALNSRERAAGFYNLKRVSTLVSDQLWLKRKEKEIIEKLEKQNKTYSKR